MSELSGTLEGVGLPAIVRFLTGLKKTGCLSVKHESWHGEIFFSSGEVKNAAFGSRHGLPALDALIEALPTASFQFDSEAAPPATPDVTLTSETLLAHLDELQAKARSSAPRLPALDAVPSLIDQPETSSSEDPLPLDRGTLQTLVAIDGQRTVREIITQRGSFDALWQLANLLEVGLVRLNTASGGYTTANAPTIVNVPAPTAANAPTLVNAPASTAANVRPIGLEALESPVEALRCPKLGFEDDPSTSFGRPTRLHRCFAAGAPLPLSLDQQRELCISDQFGTCPRLAMATGTLNAPRTENRATPPETDDPRIVRLPVGGRAAAASRDAAADRQAVGGSDSSRFRSNGAPARDGGGRPTPLRWRQERNEAVAAEAATPAPEPIVNESKAARASLVDETSDRRLVGIPVQALAGGAVIILVLAVLGFLLAPHVGDLFTDEPSDVDISALPNSSAIAAGTPISQLRGTPAPRATNIAGGAAANAAPTAASAASTTGASPSGSSAASAPPQPTLPPEPTVAPTPVLGNTVMDERFANNARNWPSSAQGTAVLSSGSYRMIPRAAGQFVAIGAPITQLMQDVVVSATFHKLSGPAGGGYGIILRDQAAAPQNGTAQNGKYYVLEVGDKGDVGIWRRDGDHWVDLLPWQKADAVKPGSATNDLMVRAIGNKLTLSVNGTEVATRTDETFSSGLVGLFVGGDGNQVAIDRFTVQTP